MMDDLRSQNSEQRCTIEATSYDIILLLGGAFATRAGGGAASSTCQRGWIGSKDGNAIIIIAGRRGCLVACR